MVTHDLCDLDGHVIAETTSAGVTTREYIWLDDMPVAVIDAVNTASPVTYFVHTDHLMRPLKMTDAAKAVAWDAVWKPFGETFSITSAPKLDLGFPGQWTQSENGLAWNWHRHYDPTTGRYTKPDPLRFVDGPSLYGYAGQRPNVLVDKDGHFAQILVAICKNNPAMCVAAAAAAGAYVSNVFKNPAIIPNDHAIIPKDPARSPNEGIIPEKCGVWPIVRHYRQEAEIAGALAERETPTMFPPLCKHMTKLVHVRMLPSWPARRRAQQLLFHINIMYKPVAATAEIIMPEEAQHNDNFAFTPPRSFWKPYFGVRHNSSYKTTGLHHGGRRHSRA